MAASGVKSAENGLGAVPAGSLDPSDTFAHRHIGPSEAEIAEMLEFIGCASLDELADQASPASIRLSEPMELGPARGEAELLDELKRIASMNRLNKSFIGMGYYGTITPPVIQRNVLENPGWYTQYTPYQAEIAQGRLEALLNFQTVVSDLTGLPLAGASLLDEATAAAEAMAMCFAIAKGKRNRFFVDSRCHPQTIAVVQGRAEPLDIEVVVGEPGEAELDDGFAGVLVQYPATDGEVRDPRKVVEAAHEAGAVVVMATDLLALTLITPPGELGADIAIGSSQRLGVPMGYGGPHAAFIATHESNARKMPGRIIGVSKDEAGNPALRMAIQTREQHIKRDRATSNICTAQALLAIMAGFYAVYHGPEGLRKIAARVRAYAGVLKSGLASLGHQVETGVYFDTLKVTLGDAAVGGADGVARAAAVRGLNVRRFEDGTVGVSLDETTNRADIAALFEAFNHGNPTELDVDALHAECQGSALADLPEWAVRASGYLTHPVFNTYRSETDMLRYIFTLQERDLSLAHGMIPLGSCTMKLNATSEMLPVTWPEFASLHPFCPPEQAEGYFELFRRLREQLKTITGFEAVSLMPNAGAQGEYAGLLTIRAYHQDRGDTRRKVCLIPTSAHGTNPASAVMAGFRVVGVECDKHGNISLEDLIAKADQHADELGALMVTYPSTHGVFEGHIREVIKAVHDRGGLVYMDGANMNAQVGLTSPGEIGADVCHLNLHKTFCIPHGGGGPGMGPIGVNAKLAPYLPTHPVMAPDSAGAKAVGPISAAPFGSASILPISWVYIALMGGEGLTKATKVAILNANYMAERLKGAFDVVYRAESGRVAHEFILDCRPFAKGGDHDAGLVIDDFAKRLMDYGFHGPTMSWPVPGTLMVEPTESESKVELDRFCDAMLGIRAEIDRILAGELDRENNPLKRAPHTAQAVIADEWERPYSREEAAFPMPETRARKFWPAVGRIDNPHGDRNLICTCPSVSELAT